MILVTIKDNFICHWLLGMLRSLFLRVRIIPLSFSCINIWLSIRMASANVRTISLISHTWVLQEYHHQDKVLCSLLFVFSFRESIQVLLSTLKKFWIDLVLNFTIAVTEMLLRQSYGSLKPNWCLNKANFIL